MFASMETAMFKLFVLWLWYLYHNYDVLFKI